MVTISVSAPLEVITKLREKAHSNSKVFQVGAKVVLSGGVNNIEELKEENINLRGQLDVKDIRNGELISKVRKFESENFDLKQKIEWLEKKVVDKRIADTK